MVKVMSKKEKVSVLSEMIMKYVKDKKPKTVKQLVKLVQESHSYPIEEVIEEVLKLQKEGKLALREDEEIFPKDFQGYVLSDRAAWFWIVITVSLITIMATLTIPENAFPLVYVRYLLGLLYVLFFPGYSFLRAVFPRKELEYLEQIVVSLCISIVFVFLIGLFLNYTPWGITLTPIVICILTLTFVFSLAALFVDYRMKLGEFRGGADQ